MCLTAFLNFACRHERSPNDNFEDKKNQTQKWFCSSVVLFLLLGWVVFVFVFVFNFEFIFWMVLSLSSSIYSCQRIPQMPNLE